MEKMKHNMNNDNAIALQKKTQLIAAHQTEILFNNIELAYSENIGITENLHEKTINIIESFKSKNRRKLDNACIQEVQRQISYWKNKYPTAKIAHFYQFSKGTIKTNSEMKAIYVSQQNADIMSIYEQNPQQSKLAFENQISNNLSELKDKQVRIILEAESINLIEKISIAQSKGIADFLFIGGRYSESNFWLEAIDLLKILKAKATILFLQRMNTHTKVSFFKFAIEIGADYAVHGSPSGRPKDEDKKEYLYLDSKDLKYKKITELEDVSINEKKQTTPSDKEYNLSRWQSIKSANSYASSSFSKRLI